MPTTEKHSSAWMALSEKTLELLSYIDIVNKKPFYDQETLQHWLEIRGQMYNSVNKLRNYISQKALFNMDSLSHISFFIDDHGDPGYLGLVRSLPAVASAFRFCFDIFETRHWVSEEEKLEAVTILSDALQKMAQVSISVTVTTTTTTTTTPTEEATTTAPTTTTTTTTLPFEPKIIKIISELNARYDEIDRAFSESEQKVLNTESVEEATVSALNTTDEMSAMIILYREALEKVSLTWPAFGEGNLQLLQPQQPQHCHSNLK